MTKLLFDLKTLLFLGLLLMAPLFSQGQNRDVLLINASQRYTQNGTFPATGNETWYAYVPQASTSDPTIESISEHLQGLLSSASDYSDVQVDFISEGTASSLADIYYDPQFSSIKSSIINGGYKYVIFFDSEQAYAYPEIMYEACKQFSGPILEAGGTPMLMMYYSTYVDDVDQLGEFVYRAANGNGIDVVPAGYAIDAAGLQGRRTGTELEEQAMISASAIYRKITGLNAANSSYAPSSLSSASVTTLANYATDAVDTHETIEHYTTSYENDGAVVYRDIDISSAPLNNVVNYFYKGSSTHNFTGDRLNTIINNTLTATERKLGNQLYGTRNWTTDDLALRQTTFSNNADLGLFLYVGGSNPGAYADDIIASNQSNIVPLVFDWIKAFESTSGVTSTTNALNGQGCADLWFNYHFRGWRTIPLTIGMGRLNETLSNFIASDDALHVSDPLVYMNASMIIASSMGTKLSVPSNLPIRTGSWTQTQLETAIDIGHDLIKELAYMSETFSYIPDSDLSIETKSIPEIPANSTFSFPLVASGGAGSYTWEYISSTSLPNGLSLSSTGVLSGTAGSTVGFEQDLVFKVTDAAGAIRKVSLTLTYGEASAGSVESLAHWPLDDESGTNVSDISGNGFDGALSNGTWATGIDNGAVEFNGTNTSISLPSSAFGTVSNELSIAMWVYGNNSQPKNNSVLYAENTAGQRLLNIHLPWSNSKVFWDAGNASGYDRISKVASSQEYKGQWNHWIFTKNATEGTMSIYLNGELWQSGTGHTTPIGNISEVTLGSQIGGSLSYDGLIDDVRLYNVELSSIDAALLYSEGIIVYEEYFDNDGQSVNTATGGGWANTSSGGNWSEGNDASYANGGKQYFKDAVMYSENSFQSDQGFELEVAYTTSGIGGQLANRFTFGLVSSETDLSNYDFTLGSIFGNNSSDYSIGVALTTNTSTGTLGLNYANGSTLVQLDESGTNQDFVVGSSTPVVIKVESDGSGGANWSYSINNILEATGNIATFDFTKSYHFAAFAQDDEYSKSIQYVSIKALGSQFTTTGSQFIVNNKSFNQNDVSPISSDEISIYPNPVTNRELTISFPDESDDKTTIRLYRIDGVLLLENSYHNAEQNINMTLNEIPSGTYILEITREDVVSNEKVIFN